MMSSEEDDAIVFDEDYTPSSLNYTKKNSVRTSPARWFMLFLGSAVALINGIQNLQFAGCETQVIEFFNVSFLLGDLLTQAYYISFVVLAFPVIWLVMKKGLRFTVVCAATLMFIGATLTTISAINKDFFFMALTSEFVAGFAQVFVLCLPSLLAGAWFPTNEISTASGTIVFFYELGNGLALLIPPLLVKKEYFGATMGVYPLTMFGAVAGFSLVIFVLVRFFFEDKPKYPPNQAQASANGNSSTSYCQSLKNLMTNRNFILLFLSYGIDFGVFSAVQSLFKAVLADNFAEVSDVRTGQIVAFMILVGTPAPLVFGALLDKTKKFIWILLFIHAICISSTVLLALAMKLQLIWMVWVAIGIFGFGFTGKMSVGLETAAEMTYPEPEGTSSGLLVWLVSVFTTIFIQIMRFLLTIANVYVNLFLVSCSVLAFLFTCFMKSDLRRSRANYEELRGTDSME